MSLHDKKGILREGGLCFKCLKSKNHFAKDCPENILCTICQSSRHLSSMHHDEQTNPNPASIHGGEGTVKPLMSVDNKCTSVCGENGDGRASASKIILVKIYPEKRPDLSTHVYATIDVASNRSLISPSLCDKLMVNEDRRPYTLSTCAGVSVSYGMNVKGMCLESINGEVIVSLPSLLECGSMVNDRGEIADPTKFCFHPHLAPLAKIMPKIEPDAKMGLLIGRDIAPGGNCLKFVG